MAGARVAHATLSPIVIGIALGLAAASSVWKMHFWREQRKVTTVYDLLKEAEVNVAAADE